MTATTDHSTQYILDESAPYLENLAALWSADPALAAEIEALDDHSRYTVEPTRSGAATLSAMASDGRSILLHSRYDPVAEARKLLEQTAIDQSMAFYVFGMGLGYHVEAL